MSEARPLRRNRLLKLEQRILFDAAATAEVLTVDQTPTSAPADRPAEALVTEPQNTAAPTVAALPAATQGEFVFVDANIANWQQLVAELGRPATVVVLDANRDGLSQINDALAGLNDITAIHLLSHGDNGSLVLGNVHLDAATLNSRQAEIAAWGQHMATDADILVYACDTARNANGIAFVDQLAALTGADVAASTNATGSAAAGGDWTLEYHIGTIQTTTLAPAAYGGLLTGTSDGFGDVDYNGDNIADPLRMITWNVIGLDSNKPATDGPAEFMVGIRVQTDSAGLSNYTVKIVDDDGKDVFGTGIVFADSTVPTSDFDDGTNNIYFPNRTAYTNVNIAANSYKDFYFNVEVLRLLSSHGQIQPFHFEVFQDANNDGNWTAGEAGHSLDKFSWLPDAAAANTPLYLYVEKYISQARNDVTNETGPAGAAAIRVAGYVDANGQYPSGPITIFVGQTLSIRAEGETATQGYPQLTFSTVFDTEIFQINSIQQAYAQYLTTTTYQQGLGIGQEIDGNFATLDGINENTTMYANPAGWNPLTHSLMITSAPPKAGGGPLVSDYSVTVTGTGSGTLSTLILDYSGSSFHYNADANSGVEGIDFVRFVAVNGAIVGTVKADTNGDGIGDSAIAGVLVTLKNQSGTVIGTATSDASGNYVFTNLQPGTYTVEEGAAPGYGDVGDSDGSGNGRNTVQVTIGSSATVATAGDLGVTGLGGLAASDLLGYQRADFVEGQPDLRLSKTASTLFPQLNGNVSFTLTVSNSSAVSAPYVEIKDYLPAGLQFVSASGNGSFDPVTGVWTLASGVAGNASQSIVITAQLVSDGPVSNFAEIYAVRDALGNALGDPDSTAGNNAGGSRALLEDDEARVTVEAQSADLGLIKTASNLRPNVGDEVTFTIVVTNSGANAATNISITDALPSGLSYTRASGAAGFDATDWSATAGTFDGSAWTIASLANGATATLTVYAKVTGAGSIANTAEITACDQFDPDSTHGNHVAGEDDQASVTLIPHAADLSLSSVVSNRSPQVGETVTYTLIVSNGGPDAVTGVVVANSLPAGVTYQSDNGVGSYVSGTGLWSVGALAVGETKTLNITVVVNQTGTLTNTAQITASSLPDPDSAVASGLGVDDLSDGVSDDDETSVVITPGAADLALSKRYSVDVGTLDTKGEYVTFTLTVTNTSTVNAYNVKVADTLSSGLTYRSITSNQGGAYSGSGTAYTWTVGDLAAGASKTLVYKATVDSLLAQSSFAQIVEMDATASDQPNGISTLVDVDSTPNNDVGQTMDEDDEALVSLPAIPYADLQLSQTVSNPTPTAGGYVIFTLTITNTGKDQATGVQVTDYLTGWANEAVFADYTIDTASDALTGSTFTTRDADGKDNDASFNSSTGLWTVGSLAYGESATLKLAAQLYPSTGANKFDNDFFNNAQVIASSLPDPDSTVNNGVITEDDYSSVKVFASASTRYDVAVSGSVSINGGAKSATSTLAAGDTVVYTITVRNDGSNFDNPALIVDWPDGNITLNSITQTASKGQIQYTTDADGLSVAWTASGQAAGANWTGQSLAPTYINLMPYNDAGGNTKMTAGTTVTYVLTGTVTANGASASTIGLSTFWAAGSSPDVDSSLSPGGTTNPATNDLLTDDLGDGIRDDDETTLTIGGGQRVDLELGQSVSTDGGQNFLSTAKLLDGDTVTLRLHLSNNATNANATATNITIADVLPTGLTFVNSYGDGSYAIGNWTLSQLEAGRTADLYIVAKVNWTTAGTSSLTNYAEVSAQDQIDFDSTKNNHSGRGTGSDPASEDDNASVILTKQLPLADLSLTQSLSSSTPDINGNVTITLTVNNAGPNTATGVTALDLLPAGLVYQSSSGDGSYADGTGIWDIGSIASGASKQIQIVAKVTSTATLTNFAQVRSNALDDPDSTPNNGDHNPDEDDEMSASLTARAADLSLTKTVSDSRPNVGDTVSFTLTVINSGPNSTDNVSVLDSLPANFTVSHVTYNSAASGDSYSGGVWTLGTVNVGEVHTLTITGTITSAAPSTSFAQIKTSSLADPDSTPNNDSNQTANEDDEAIVAVTPRAADLQLAKAVSNATPNVGSDVTFTLTLVNAGPDAATNVVVTDYLPTGMTWVSGGSNSGGTVTWNVGSLAVGEVKTLAIVATITTPDAIVNFAQVTAVDQYDADSTKNNNGTHLTSNEDDEARVTVDARQADLALAKTVDRAAPMLGDNVTFTLTVSNLSSSDDATGVEITDLLPAGFTFVSASDGAVRTAGSPDSIVWSGLTIAANSSRSLTVVARADSASALSNSASITASDLPDPGNGNNSASVSVDAQQADLSLSKSVVVSNRATADSDGFYTATFTLQVTNSGPDAATHVAVRDLLPAGVQFIGTGNNSDIYNPQTGLWSIGTIASGATATLDIIARVTSPAAIANYAQIVAVDQPDPDSTPNDNSGRGAVASQDDNASAGFDVTLVDLSLQKTISNPTPVNGDVITYVITLRNAAGFDAANNIAVAETLPAGLTLLSVTPSTGSYDANSRIWTVPTLLGGGSATLTISGTVSDIGQLVNVAEITACDEFDIDSAPNNRGSSPGEDDSAEARPSALAMITGRVLDDRGGSTANAFDAGDTPIAGVTVRLYAASDTGFATPLASAVTDSRGVYTLYAPAGNYVVVQEDANGYRSVASLQSINATSGVATLDTSDPGYNRKAMNLAAGDEYYENNFLDLTPWQIEGTVTTDADHDGAAIGDAGDTALQGVSVRLYQATGAGSDQVYGTADDVWTQVGSATTTDASGHYQFAGLGVGRYRVIESNPAGYNDVTDSDGSSSNTASQVDVVLQRNMAGSTATANFLDVLPLGTIAGRVTRDADHDGAPIGDPDDTPIASVTLRLYNATNTLIATTTSAVDGTYSFSGLAAGNYTVREVNPAGLVSVADSDGGNDDSVAASLGGGTVSGVNFLDETTGANSPPVAENNSYTVTEDNVLSARNIITDDDNGAAAGGLDNDLEGSPLTIESIDGTAWASLTGSANASYPAAGGWKQLADSHGTAYHKQDGSLVYVPASNDTTGLSFTYTVSDGTAGSNSATVTIAVTPQNDPPVARDNAYSVSEDTLLASRNIIADNTGAGADSDVDTANGSLFVHSVTIGGSEVTFGNLNDGSGARSGWKELTLAHGTAWLKADGSLEYQGASNDFTGDSFNYKISDGTATSGNALVTLTVTPVNDPPVAENNSYTTTENTLLSGRNILSDDGNGAAAGGIDSDIDGDPLSVASVGGTAWNSLNGSSDATYTALAGWKEITLAHGTAFLKQDGSLVYRPNTGDSHGDTFTYQAGDGNAASNSATVTLAVTPTSADLLTIKTLYGGNANPAEGEQLIFRISVGNQGGAQATNVHLTEQLPAGLSLVAATSSQGSYDPVSGVWTIGTLANGQGATLDVTVRVDAGHGGQAIMNTVSAATADQADPSTAGDDLSETIVVQAPPAATPPVLVAQPPTALPLADPVPPQTAVTQPAFTPALHVLAAVEAAQTSSNGGGNESGILPSTLNSNLLTMDPSLHVLPAVAQVQPDIRAVASAINTAANRSFGGNSILAAFDAPARPLALPAETTSRAIPDDVPPPRNLAPAAPAPAVDNTGEQDSDKERKRPTAPAARPADGESLAPRPPAGQAAAGHQTFSQQIRQAADRHGTRQLAQQLHQTVAGKRVA